MARLQPIDPAATSGKVRQALDNLPPLNIFRTLAHAETAFRPFLEDGDEVVISGRAGDVDLGAVAGTITKAA